MLRNARYSSLKTASSLQLITASPHLYFPHETVEATVGGEGANQWVHLAETRRRLNRTKLVDIDERHVGSWMCDTCSFIRNMKPFGLQQFTCGGLDVLFRVTHRGTDEVGNPSVREVNKLRILKIEQPGGI